MEMEKRSAAELVGMGLYNAVRFAAGVAGVLGLTEAAESFHLEQYEEAAQNLGGAALCGAVALDVPRRFIQGVRRIFSPNRG